MNAHQGNMAEIMVGRMAEQKGKSNDVRSIGTLLVTDHSRLDRTLQDAARRLGVTLPTRPSAKQRAEAARLNAMSGAAFDRAWLAALIKDHRADATATRREEQSGGAAEAKQIAMTSLPVIEKHLKRLMRAHDPVAMPQRVPAGSGGWAMTMPNQRPLVLGYGLLAAGMLVTAGGALLWRRPALWRR